MTHSAWLQQEIFPGGEFYILSDSAVLKVVGQTLADSTCMLTVQEDASHPLHGKKLVMRYDAVVVIT